MNPYRRIMAALVGAWLFGVLVDWLWLDLPWEVEASVAAVWALLMVAVGIHRLSVWAETYEDD